MFRFFTMFVPVFLWVSIFTLPATAEDGLVLCFGNDGHVGLKTSDTNVCHTSRLTRSDHHAHVDDVRVKVTSACIHIPLDQTTHLRVTRRPNRIRKQHVPLQNKLELFKRSASSYAQRSPATAPQLPADLTPGNMRFSFLSPVLLRL